MGTRTKRIPSFQLASQLGQLTGKTVQVVLWSGITRAGTVTIQDQTIILTDLNARWYNRSKHVHHLSVTDIREVILDEVSNW